MINPTITISQNEYEYLVEQAKIVKFIEHYKPSICNDGEYGKSDRTLPCGGFLHPKFTKLIKKESKNGKIY